MFCPLFVNSKGLMIMDISNYTNKIKKCLKWQISAILSLFIILCVSCKTQEVVKETYIERFDTIVEFQPDTSSMIALLECDSNYQVILKELEVANGERSHLEPQITKSGTTTKLKVESVSESKKEVLEGISESKVEKEYITEYIDKPIPKFYVNCTIGFFIILSIILLYIIIKILLKVYLHINI